MSATAPPVEPIELGNTLGRFEEAVVSFVAVEQVYGADHPLLQDTNETDLDASLWDEIHRPQETGSHVFGGESAIAIRRALAAVAQSDELSPYQPAARVLLGLPVDGANLDAKAEAAGETRPEPSAPEPGEPRAAYSYISEEHIILSSYGQRVTAWRAIEDFAEGDDQQASIDRIRADIKLTDPFTPEALAYDGDVGRTIYNSLAEAANRREKLHDYIAARMMEAA